jgi:transposase
MKSLGLSDGVAGAEGARRATGAPAAGADGSVPDPAVSEKAKRRQFTAEYKLRILREVEQCKAPGETGEILRREGLYSSHLTDWRRQRDQIARRGLAQKKRGPKAKSEDPRIKELERENTRLKRRLQRAEAILEIQKKASELLGIPLSRLDEDDTG